MKIIILIIIIVAIVVMPRKSIKIEVKVTPTNIENDRRDTLKDVKMYPEL